MNRKQHAQVRRLFRVASGLCFVLFTSNFFRLGNNRETAIITGARSHSKRFTTPQILHGALAGLCLSALILFLASFAGTRQHRLAVKTVGQDAAPSIIAAQSIKASLADMDANVANELMVSAGQNTQSIEGYAQRRREVGNNLLGAAENITYGDAERQPLRTMEAGLSDYEALVTRARVLYERGNGEDSLKAYRQANHVLEDTLYPAADALANANADVLERAYAHANAVSTGLTVLVLTVGAALLGLLVVTQVFLSRRMHRTLNPSLLLATFLTACFVAYTTRAFFAAANHLRIAKKDAFASIQLLWQARAVAYDANTDESRWLLDRALAPTYETAFFAKAVRLLEPPNGQSYENVAEATRGALPAGTKGYLARELGNITFAGEQEAAQEMVKTFGVYYAADKKIRALQNEGRHDASVAFCISMAPGDSNWAFAQFDNALGKTLDINKHAFESAVSQGFQDLNGMELYCALVAGGIAALAFVGLRPRIKEYA